ncbi:hypothetical protein BgiBS90_026102, partial [Biomphalaria glabrata]
RNTELGCPKLAYCYTDGRAGCPASCRWSIHLREEEASGRSTVMPALLSAVW